MTQQEYNDYIAHGGKWGYTNGVPNGKKKAAKKYMNSVGKDMNSVGKYLKNGVGKYMKNGVGKYMNHVGETVGDSIKERRSFEGAMEREMAAAGKKASSKLSPKVGKEVVNTEDTDRYGKIKSSKSSQDAAKKYGKTAQKVLTAYEKKIKEAAKKYKNKEQSKKDFSRVGKDIEKKHGKTLDKYGDQMAAGKAQKAREKKIIAAAKRQDALRQQSSKSKKLEKTRKAQKELDKLHRSMYDRTKLYEGPKSLDDHKKENRTPKKHGQSSTTRGVQKQ